MESVTYRDGKAGLVAGISLMGGTSAIAWLVFLLVKNDGMPWWVWLIPSSVTALSLGLVAAFSALLIGCKSVVSRDSLAQISFGKKKEMRREDILLVADEAVGKGRYYVAYPKGYDPEAIRRHAPSRIGVVASAKAVAGDERLLRFIKTKRMSELLETFGYTVSLVID